MGSLPVAGPARRVRALLPRRWPLVVVALLSFGVLAVSITLAVILPDTGPKADLVDAGDPDDFEIGKPVHFAGDGFWLVRMEGDIFVAVADQEPLDGDATMDCPVEWAGLNAIVAEVGLFKGSRSGSLFDVGGTLFFGPAPRGLDRFPARIEEGRVRVDVGTRVCGNGLPAPGAECLFPRPLQ